jgi:hypothetical protein
MPYTRAIEQKLQEPPPLVAPDAPKTITELRTRLAESLALNAALAARVAELELPEEPWMALKPAAYECKLQTETARVWCVRGQVIAKQDGHRWLTKVSSLMARRDRLGTPRTR